MRETDGKKEDDVLESPEREAMLSPGSNICHSISCMNSGRMCGSKHQKQRESPSQSMKLPRLPSSSNYFVQKVIEERANGQLQDSFLSKGSHLKEENGKESALLQSKRKSAAQMVLESENKLNISKEVIGGPDTTKGPGTYVDPQVGLSSPRANLFNDRFPKSRFTRL